MQITHMILQFVNQTPSHLCFFQKHLTEASTSQKVRTENCLIDIDKTNIRETKSVEIFIQDGGGSKIPGADEASDQQWLY